MEIIESRISKSYSGLVVFLHIVIIGIVLISLTYLRNIFYIEKRIFAGVIIFIMIIALFLLWNEILSGKKVVVDSNGIKIYNAKSIREIAFSEINKIKKEKTKLMMKGVPFSDGFTYSEIVLNEGKSLIISPDKYENYLEIMALINSKIDERTFKNILINRNLK